MAPLQRGKHPVYTVVDLLVGFWPPNLVNYKRDYFVPRAGGVPYSAGWDALAALTPKPDIVLVESYNEITEGSHLMASWPVGHTPGDGHWTGDPDDPKCAQQPCHPVEYTDSWGSSNPWHYLDLTRRRIDDWLRGPVAGADRVAPHAWLRSPRDGDVVSDAVRLVGGRGGRRGAARSESLPGWRPGLQGPRTRSRGSSRRGPCPTACTVCASRPSIRRETATRTWPTLLWRILTAGIASRIAPAVRAIGSGDEAGSAVLDCTRYEPVATSSEGVGAPLVTLRAVRVPCLGRD